MAIARTSKVVETLLQLVDMQRTTMCCLSSINMQLLFRTY